MPEVIDVDDFNRMHGKLRNKYGAKRADFRGRTYASIGERDYATILFDRLARGDLKLVLPQVPIRLDVTHTIVDFLVVTREGEPQVHEFKGAMTAKFRIVVRAWRKYGPCPMHVVKHDRRNGRTVQIIERQ